MRCVDRACRLPNFCEKHRYCKMFDLDGTPMTEAKRERNRRRQADLESKEAS